MKAEAPQRLDSFSTFWPYYIAEHSKASTRSLHFAGTALSLICLLLLIGTGRWRFLAIALVLGYGFAWAGHLFFEKNRPATFSYPLYSLAADWKMFFLMFTGRMEAEMHALAARRAVDSESLETK